MAGPTPVSALIHAATMVTAGVYMVARCNVLLPPRRRTALVVVARSIGGFTATLRRDDRPRPERHQEGAGVLDGLAARLHVPRLRRRRVRRPGMFHVMTHAFFKACLFLGSGSVIHALSGEQDIREDGRPRSEDSRHTYRTFLVATLAISGVPLLAGFLLEGRDPRRGVRARFEGMPWLPKVLWARRAPDGGTHGLLHVPARLADVLRDVPRRRRSRRRTSTSRRRSMTVPLMRPRPALSVVGGCVGIPSSSRRGIRIEPFLSPILLPLAAAATEPHATSSRDGARS